MKININIAKLAYSIKSSTISKCRQKIAEIRIYLTPYVCNEQKFEGLQF